MIHYTKDFSKALIGICILSLMLIVPETLLQINRRLLFDISNSNTFISVLPYKLILIVSAIGLWSAIGYASKEYKGAIIGFSINFLYFGISLFAESSKLMAPTSLSFLSLFLSALAFMAFGWIYFKKKEGLFLGIMALLVLGMHQGNNVHRYYDFIEMVLEVFGMKNLLTLKYAITETTSTNISLIRNLLYRIYLPLSFIMFWFVFNSIKKIKTFDPSLRTVTILDKDNNLTYSIIHWVTRIALVVSLFSSLHFMRYISREGFGLFMFTKTISYCLSIFIVASIYRNVLLSFFVQKKKYPSWYYLFMNIPYSHVIFWGVLMFEKPRMIPLVAESPLEKIRKSQEAFIHENKNQAIIIFAALASILKLVVEIAGISTLNQQVYGNISAIFILAAFINIVVNIWYMLDRRALYILFVIQSLFIFINHEFFLSMLALSSFAFLVVNYALFHYDQFKFVHFDNEKNEDNDLQQLVV